MGSLGDPGWHSRASCNGVGLSAAGSSSLCCGHSTSTHSAMKSSSSSKRTSVELGLHARVSLDVEPGGLRAVSLNASAKSALFAFATSAGCPSAGRYKSTTNDNYNNKTEENKKVKHVCLSN